MEKEEAEFKALFAKYLAWKASQENQSDGYMYEKSFVEFAQEFTKELLKLSLQSKPKEASRKKKFKPV